MSDRLSTVDQAIDAVARGQVIIVMDDEQRENEGDFICAAEKVTTEIVNFMITHGRGQLCMPILPEVCDRLELRPMVEENTAPLAVQDESTPGMSMAGPKSPARRRQERSMDKVTTLSYQGTTPMRITAMGAAIYWMGRNI